MISIHVPAWGTTAFPGLCRPRLYYFNPRSRVGNDCTLRPFHSIRKDFNPRSRVGNDHVLVDREKEMNISIHVPAWGTTLRHPVHLCNTHISIHVPAWGTTFNYIWGGRGTGFQSTFPRGERLAVIRMLTGIILISIHVPAWGTTFFTVWKIQTISNFNPRSRVGNDCKFQQFFTYIFV